jgi:MFS family permease
MKSTFRPVSSLLLGVAFLICGNGLLFVLIPLRATHEGWTAVQVGALGSAYYIGFVLGCLAGPYVILRAGHIRAFAAAVALATAATVAHPLWVAVGPWFVLRLLIGASFAALYTVIESWLNDRATNDTRGLIMSAYIVVNFVGIAVGQLIVSVSSATDFTPFAIATVFMSLAIIPVALTRSAQPAPIALVRFRPRALYEASPVGVIGVTVVGIANGAFWSLGAVAAVGVGLTGSEAAIFMAIATIGGALSQWPAGRFSDLVDRRLVLAVCLIAALIVGLLLAVVPASGSAWFVLAFLFGMATLPTYSLSAAHAYDHAAPDTFVETAAGLLLANAFGSIVGPLLAAPLMQQVGPQMLFVFMAVAQGLLAAFVVYRLRVRRPVPTEDKTTFDLAATAPIGGVISPEQLDPQDPNVATPQAVEIVPTAPGDMTP